MKTIFITASLLLGGTFLQAQQIDLARNAHFVKSMDEINSGKSVLKYSDIQGNPFYKNGFSEARIGDTGTTLPVRYNMYKDAFEVRNDSDIYAIPKENTFSKFVFVATNEKFILANDDEGFAGYFLVLTEGKNKLLKKIAVKFSPEVPAPNTLIPGTPAKFENQKPVYYIKTDENIIKLTKKSEDLLSALPSDKKDAVKDFIKTKKIKFNQELDLIALANFLNK
ncbi:hypothetical protein [Epilithonimonas caeni]|uniref:hypothetical protein n=1 Tax=Epilithonimonas caeni TaxID=365343 RepID=UPI000487A799|nr:hypothetical protein [Epilithonimonas caeni]